MRSLITRFTSLAALAALMAAPLAPVSAQSAMSAGTMAVTGSGLGAITKLSNKYFHAVITSDLTTLKSITTPDFTATRVNGHGTTDAAGLIAEVQALKLQVTQITGSTKAQSATTNGTTTVAIVSLAASGNSLQALQNLSISRNATHQLTLLKTAGGWKIQSDKLLKQKITS